MSDNTLTLTPHNNGKLGVVHVGVTTDGVVYVAGERAVLADGESTTFSRSGVTVTRRGEEFHFSK
ncbi:MAG TPA: hypothetical protein ENK54_07580 [Thiotrichales bacterium]|nr:hypothetical protein [Thiotrichales bacterium]